MRRHLTRSATILAAGTAVALTLAPASPASTAVTCDRVVAATGSDTAAGTADAPFRTIRRLVTALEPGQTGCVRGEVTENVWVTKPGVTITSEPGQRGRLMGQIVIDPDADHVTVRDLDLNARGLVKPSPIVLGDDATIVGNDITNDRTPVLCMILGALGHDSGATASRTRIEANRIHDCGVVNNHRHGIYVEHAEDTRIVGNRIYDNADRGIQLFPSSQRTLIAGNVIDGNGQGIIFSGTDGVSSSGNVVRNNVITNQRLRAGIESWWDVGTPRGVDNVAFDNCMFGGRLIDLSNGGFTAHDNRTADPLYADRDAKDFRLRADSPCTDLLATGLAELQVARAEDVSGAVVPAPPAAPKPLAESAAPATSAPVVVSVEPTANPSVVRVEVTLKPGAKPSLAKVEVRRGKRWTKVATPRLRPKRSYVRKVRVKGRRKVAVRARLLTESKSAVATLGR